MRQLSIIVISIGCLVMADGISWASYKGSGGGGGSSSSGRSGSYQSATKDPAIMAVEKHIDSKSSGGAYKIRDRKTGKTRKLRATGIGNAPRRTNSYQSIVIARFVDMNTEETVEVDFTVKTGYGQPRVDKAVIYAVNGRKY